ncbi:hypothetical protein [Sulfuricurvum sp.]|uniref:hypothetical protein n=1 Tax=Sulfuricurvum sp. TaxID=2025608 RepID=UPI0035695674
MSKRNHNGVPNIPVAPTIPPEQKKEPEKLETLVRGFVLAVSDKDAQNKVISDQMRDGWEHYESVPMGGNEIYLRFRRKQ